MPEITLYQFAADAGTESASPFCVKVHRALGLKGLEYKVRNVFSPKELSRINPEHKKLPVLGVGSEFIVDSTEIIKYLDANYSENQILRESDPWFVAMLEDWADVSLYWFAVYYRWQVSEHFDPFAKRAFAKLPLPLRWVIPGVVRKKTLKSLHAQGIGRFSESEIREQLRGHLAHLDRLVSEHEWMSGSEIGVADLAIFPLVRQFSLEAMPLCRPLVLEFERLHAWLKAVDAKTSTEHTVAVA
tara:strand:- start:16502 stop:17233 length:732 start_codon:yes stop_codon:yes gene_type:complete